MTEHLADERAQEVAGEGASSAEAVHLGACPDCRLLVEDYKALVAGLDALPQPNPPPDFAAGVFALIRRRRRLQWLQGALGLLLLVPASAVAAGACWLALRSLSGCAPWVAGCAAAVRVGITVMPLLLPLQLAAALGCVALALPVVLVVRRLLPDLPGEELR